MIDRLFMIHYCPRGQHVPSHLLTSPTYRRATGLVDRRYCACMGEPSSNRSPIHLTGGPALCKGCRYPLPGIAGKCPECGRTFDLADGDSFQTTKQIRLRRLNMLTLWIVVSHSVILIGGGHGVGPIGLFYTMCAWTSEDLSPIPILAGTLGVLVAGLIWTTANIQRRKWTLTASVLGLSVGTTYFIHISELGWLTWVTAIPFIAISLQFLVRWRKY